MTEINPYEAPQTTTTSAPLLNKAVEFSWYKVLFAFIVELACVALVIALLTPAFCFAERPHAVPQIRSVPMWRDLQLPAAVVVLLLLPASGFLLSVVSMIRLARLTRSGKLMAAQLIYAALLVALVFPLPLLCFLWTDER